MTAQDGFWREDEPYIVECCAPGEVETRLVASGVPLLEADRLRHSCLTRGEIAIVYPARYTSASMNLEQALACAVAFLRRAEGAVRDDALTLIDNTPYYWKFHVKEGVLPEDREPNVLLVDSLDGHVWSLEDVYCCARRHGRL